MKPMIRWTRSWLNALASVIATFSMLSAGLAQAQVPEESRQLVITVSDNWEATTGLLYAFERDTEGWNNTMAAVPVNLGRTGLAWGVGLHPGQDGVQKREGDGKAPAGIFRLGDAFGYAEKVDTGLAYQPMSASHYCIDMPESPLYNQTVTARDVGEDAVKGSSEGMRRDIHYGDQQYRQGIFIAHNPDNKPGAGSCIFVHLWESFGNPTAGCTALGDEHMAQLLRWLNADSQPVYVALPRSQYQLLQQDWQLPPLPQ